VKINYLFYVNFHGR